MANTISGASTLITSANTSTDITAATVAASIDMYTSIRVVNDHASAAITYSIWITRADASMGRISGKAGGATVTLPLGGSEELCDFGQIVSNAGDKLTARCDTANALGITMTKINHS